MSMVINNDRIAQAAQLSQGIWSLRKKRDPYIYKRRKERKENEPKIPLEFFRLVDW